VHNEKNTADAHANQCRAAIVWQDSETIFRVVTRCGSTVWRAFPELFCQNTSSPLVNCPDHATIKPSRRNETRNEKGHENDERLPLPADRGRSSRDRDRNERRQRGGRRSRFRLASGLPRDFGLAATDEPVELVTIECEPRDLRDSEDYEGSTLRAGRGQIVTRHVFTGGLIEAREWLNENA